MERIEDREELEQVREQAREVQVKTVIAGLVMTLVALLLPQKRTTE